MNSKQEKILKGIEKWLSFFKKLDEKQKEALNYYVETIKAYVEADEYQIAPFALLEDNFMTIRLRIGFVECFMEYNSNAGATFTNLLSESYCYIHSDSELDENFEREMFRVFD